MTTAFAWVDGEKATEAERAYALNNDAPMTPAEGQLFGILHTLHADGEHAEQLFVSYNQTPTTTNHADNYRAALEGLLAADERVRNGHAYSIGLI